MLGALEHRIPPPLAFLAVAAAMGGIAWLGAAPMIGLAARLALAGGCAVAAAAFAGPAVRAFLRARTTIDPVRIEAASALVTGGVYARTRNPMYLGLALLLTGWAALLGTPWALLGPLGFALFITRFQIIPEERALQAKFGATYSEYRRRARRWL